MQTSQDDLLQFAAVGTLHALDGSLDVGVQAGRAFGKRRAVIDGFVAVVYGDEIEEQAGDAPVEFVKRMQCDQLGLVMGETFGKFFRRPACSLFQVLFLFQFAEDAAGFLFKVGSAAEQGAALAHVHGAVPACPFVYGFIGVAVQRFEIVPVEADGGVEFGDEAGVGLLQQGCFYFVQQIRRFYSQTVSGNVGAGEVNLTFGELILGHGAVPSGLEPAF